MSDAPKNGWKDIAVIVTLTLNLIALIATIFGGLNWVTQVNSNQAIFQANQADIIKAVREIQQFDVAVAQRHVVEDALYPDIAKKIHRGLDGK